MKWFRQFFGFSRSEGRGFFILALLIVSLVAAPFLFKSYMQGGASLEVITPNDHLDSLSVHLKEKVDKEKSDEKKPDKQLFEFNPNTVSEEEMNQLGFPEWLANRMNNYRDAGGEFRIKSDLKKLYGFPDGLFAELKPFIDLPEELEKTVPKKEAYKKRDDSEEIKASEVPSIESFDINLADTAQLKKIYGVGPVIAKRIVDYRELLGGFVKVEQYDEIYGVSDTVLYQLKTYAFIDEYYSPSKIRINTASREELMAHPYISPSLARSIVSYREQHGPYESVVDLLQLHLMDDAKFSVIKNYISTQQ